MHIEALQARLRAVEEEILRLAKLASEKRDPTQQDDRWSLARDLQREARQIRSSIKNIAAHAG